MSNKCEHPAAARMNSQGTKSCLSATLIEKSMPILLYIAMWSCALGMASGLTPRLGRDSQNRE
jgi:hypothetical protein